MPSLVLLVWFTICAEQDIRQRRIANELTLGAAGIALLYLFSTGHTWIGASVAEGGMALALSILITLPGYIWGRLGAGDVKLLGALALATDCNHLLGTFIGAAVFMVLWAFIGPLVWKRISQRLRRRIENLDPSSSNKPPFAPFLLAGFLSTLLWIH